MRKFRIDTGESLKSGQCAVCFHKQRREINEALRAKVFLRVVAEQYGMSEAALSRHRKNHMSMSTNQQILERLREKLLVVCAAAEARVIDSDEPDDTVDKVFELIDDFRQEAIQALTLPW